MQHPEHAEALAREVDEVLGDRPPTFADLPRLRYARMAFEESLRLYGPIYWLQREALHDDEIDGRRIPKGSIVTVVSHVLHRHPDAWDRPEAFDPLRFLPERSEARPPMSWIPFGLGQRLCIGKEFAMMEGAIILATLAQRYSMKPVSGRKVDVRMGATLQMKDGLWVTLTPRTARPAPTAPIR
jgi:cytochrome P450